MVGEHVNVVGGANSAGQAALHLAKFADRITLVVRGATLAAGMSNHLITQTKGTANIDVISRHVVDGDGVQHLNHPTPLGHPSRAD
jgi:thioredoxin reductase (NADPH)